MGYDDDLGGQASDFKKRLGDKARHITWVDEIKGALMHPNSRNEYLEDVANRKDAEEKAQKRKSQESS